MSDDDDLLGAFDEAVQRVNAARNELNDAEADLRGVILAGQLENR